MNLLEEIISKDGFFKRHILKKAKKTGRSPMQFWTTKDSYGLYDKNRIELTWDRWDYFDSQRRFIKRIERAGRSLGLKRIKGFFDPTQEMIGFVW